VNFARDVVEAAPPYSRSLVVLGREGTREVLSFGEVAKRAARLAGKLAAHGVGRGDVVLMLVGSRPEWALAMVACFRLGAVACPCAEQLRGPDLRTRIAAVAPRVAVVDRRCEESLRDSGWAGPVLWVPDPGLWASEPAPAADLDPEDPALVVFTSGTSGEPRPVRHAQRYLGGQAVQAEHWLGAREGDLVWCTGASGWSKSARNAFVAPWLRGAAALLQDRRFDPEERLLTIERERVDVLCMAPTEYRAVAQRAALRPLPLLRHAVAAGEPLDPEVIGQWRERAGVALHDGYGQTETGGLTGMPLGRPVRPGSMGLPLPSFRVWVEDGELCVDPESVTTFCLGAPSGTWRTGDRARQDADGYLWFEGRIDDVIISSGYRIGPFEVESALATHPRVAEAAAVAAPDPERGSVVRAVVVLRPGAESSAELARELQDHVKRLTAPYKYPRVVDFADALPKTASGKVRRALLRESEAGGPRAAGGEERRPRP
jgi:acyl-coenzyme A synthetase/AMP-(fatty) acid ligase